jgi:hypothetical protein
MKSKKSPYLAKDGRLGDVIAAIQAMGTYKFYKLEFAEWAERIGGDKQSAEHWRTVFLEHPEFFRLDTERERASLVWRRQNKKLFDVDIEVKITNQQYDLLSSAAKERISRIPLLPADLATLINTAISLHARAVARQQEARWWVPVLVGAGGVIIGAVISTFAHFAK